MEHTQSATELMPVVVEPNGSGGADVWLNRNITTIEIELDNGLSQTMWEAEQVHYIAPNVPDVADILTSFDEVWNDHVGASDVSLNELADAMAELSEIVSDGADMAQINADAIAELSDLVSELMSGGEQ